MTIPPHAFSSGNQTFDYDAQAEDGSRFNGSLEAADAERAMNRLRSMRLLVTDLRPRGSDSASRPARPLSGSDFIAFNEQISHLAAAGLPLEAGLRLIADELRGGRLATAVKSLARDLEAGTPVAAAFDKHRSSFPPFYGRLVGAGVRSGDLSSILLSLGKHLELVQRLRSTLWRTLSYPLFVLATTLALMMFLALFVLPRYEGLYKDFHMRLPVVTLLMIQLAHVMPTLIVVIAILIILSLVAWLLLSRTGGRMAVIEGVILPLPLIGPLLRAEVVARWCDAVRLGIKAGMDLPQAIDLAADATGSRRLAADGRLIVAALGTGQPLGSVRTRSLPATVPTTIQLASGHNNLTDALETLSSLYQRQAEMRLISLPTVLSPAMVIVIASVIGFVLASLVAPFAALIEGMSGK